MAGKGFVVHVCISASQDAHCGQKNENSSDVTKQRWENVSGKDGYLGAT